VPPLSSATARATSELVVLQASSFSAAGLRVRLPRAAIEVGARAQESSFVCLSCALFAARKARLRLGCGFRGALNLQTMSRSLAAVRPHAHSATRWVTSNNRLERSSGAG
jgi:hypothetical protein